MDQEFRQTIVSWRIMAFPRDGDCLERIIDLGEAPIGEMQDLVHPEDAQEMCGSYFLDGKRLSPIADRFLKPELLDLQLDLFLERES